MAESVAELLAEMKVQTAYLREIATFIRRADLQAALDNRDKRLVYQLSDGSRSSQEVVDDGDLSKSRRTVQRWWNDWIEAGLATRLDSGSVRARYDVSVIDFDDDD